MATVQIFNKGNLKEAKFFKNTCWFIWDDSDELICLVDQEKDKGGGGVFKSTVHYASTNPEIVAVFPEWELIIDGIPQPQGFYDSVKGIDGKIVKLRFKDYECILDFTPARVGSS
jgi:hypothetical protein